MTAFPTHQRSSITELHMMRNMENQTGSTDEM